MSTNGINGTDEAHSEEPNAVMGGTARVKKLCSSCRELDLAVDKFVIYDGTFQRPKQTPDHPFPGRRLDFSLKSGSRLFPLGTLRDIEGRCEECPFCSLVLKSLLKDPEDSDQEKTTESGSQVNVLDIIRTSDRQRAFFDSLRQSKSICFVNWEIDGRDNDPTSGRKARTRRLHLHWNNKDIPDSYLVFVAPKRLYEHNSDSQGSYERVHFYLGRELTTDGNNQVLMKSWLDQCHRHHGPACSGEQNDPKFDEMAKHSYFGVIDVLDMCLKSLPLRSGTNEPTNRDPSPPGSTYDSDQPSPESGVLYEPYVALSYVWGLKKNYITDISNIRVHQQQGSLETSLREIPLVIRDAMDLVRRLGLRYLWVDSLCIVQDSKRSWNLNSRVMNLIYGNAFLTICAADGSDAWHGLKALRSRHLTTQHIEECAPGVRLMVSQLAETGISSSIWNKRAWTFQERLLSKRCLIFTDGRVFFQCRSSTMSEDLVSESHGAGWSLDLAKALPQILHELKRRPIRVYMNCMSRYSARQLTKAKDILAAFNGVSNMISDVMQAPFIFGLPSSHFDLALLWAPSQAILRRTPQPGEDFQDLVFPSWSWCGWRGGTMGYRSCQLDGVLTNVYEWLTEHTWIDWYIRDGRGNLRPVWDGGKAKACDSVEERWKGYKDEDPEREYTRLQKAALQNLGNSNEDDFIRWSKEQDQAQNEIRRYMEREKRPVLYEDDYAPRQIYRRGEFQGHRYEERVRIHSPDRHRERDIFGFGRIEERAANQESNQGDSPTPLQDQYGRKIPYDIAKRIRSGFQQCLPDNPFRVYIEPYTSHPDKDFPDQPLLQFWTWWASLRLVQSTSQATESTQDIPGIERYDIADAVGDWCGSIILDNSWVANEEKKGHRVHGSSLNFLAISDAKAFTKEECDVWTYYVPKERENSEWDLYYILLVEERDRIWYRVALGKVFKAAFDNAVGKKRWREIILG